MSQEFYIVIGLFIVYLISLALYFTFRQRCPFCGGNRFRFLSKEFAYCKKCDSYFSRDKDLSYIDQMYIREYAQNYLLMLDNKKLTKIDGRN